MCRKNSAVELELATRLDAGELRDAVTLGLQAYGESLRRSIQFVVRDEEDTQDAYGAFLEQVWKSIESNLDALHTGTVVQKRKITAPGTPMSTIVRVN